MRYNYYRILYLQICTLLILVCFGCGQAQTEPEPVAVNAGQPIASLVSLLPTPGELPKTASITSWRVRDGNRFEQLEPYSFHNVTGSGGAALFEPDYDLSQTPPHQDFAYAMYRFSLVGMSAQPAEVRCDWMLAPAVAGMLWWGLANWQLNRWDWFEADGSSPQLLPAASLDPYLDDTDRVVLCVALLGTDTAQLAWVGVGGNLPPEASYEADPLPPQAGDSVNFSATSTRDYDGNIVKYEFDFGEGGGFEDFGDVPSAVHTYNSAGQFISRLRVTDDGGLTDTDSLVIDVNELPHGVIASLTADPPSGSPVVAIEFDASGSLPSTGATITNYRFDFDGDGTADQNGFLSSGYFTFAWGGNYTASVTVTDSALQQATAYVNLPLTDTRTWETSFSTDCGGTFALVEAAGHPALAFNDGTYNLMYFVRASDAMGDTWPAPMLIDMLGMFRGRMAAELIDGKPSLACIRAITEEDQYVHYMHSSDESGMIDGGWSVSDPAESGYFIANLQSVAMIPVGTGAGIVYCSGENDAVQFIRSLDYNGSMWSSPVKVSDIELESRNLVSACIHSGKPAIAYSSLESMQQKTVYYRLATDSLGSSFGPANLVIGEANKKYGVYSLFMDDVDGTLAFTTDHLSSGSARYVYPDLEDPGSFLGINPFTTYFNPNESLRWAMLAGHPAVYGYDVRENALYLGRASNALGDEWPDDDPLTVVAGDPDGDDIGIYPVMIVIDNTPVIAYYDEGGEQVFVTVLK